MKKTYIIIISIIVLLLVLSIGMLIRSIIIDKTSDSETKVLKELADTELNNQNELEVITTSVAETKTSPNTIFIFKTYYKECEHTTLKKLDIPKQFINQTEEEIQSSYKDWKIEDFKNIEVTFSKQEEGICDQHYLIKENNGYIAIYSIDNNGKENLKETTEIVTSYLPDEDKIRLREGIKVIGQEELNTCLEDYE